MEFERDISKCPKNKRVLVENGGATDEAYQYAICFTEDQKRFWDITNPEKEGRYGYMENITGWYLLPKVK